MTWRRLVAGAVLLYAALSAVGFWRVRLAGGRLVAGLPRRLVPDHLSVLPPPSEEFVGVWNVTPAEARSRLPEAGFAEQIRAYLHAYDRDGDAVHEVGSYVHRPNGITGAWQLHVRLFPAPDGDTEVWAHWERNPYVAPFAHLRRDGYDPEKGERRVRRLVDGIE